MPLFIILPAAAAILLALFILRQIIKRNNALFKKSPRELSRRIENAIIAKAQIIHCESSENETDKNYVKTRMTFSVLKGGESYTAQAVWLVEAESISICAEGAIIPVKIDKDHLSVIYPAVPWASFVSRG